MGFVGHRNADYHIPPGDEIDRIQFRSPGVTFISTPSRSDRRAPDGCPKDQAAYTG